MKDQFVEKINLLDKINVNRYYLFIYMGKYDKDCGSRSLNLGKIFEKLRFPNGFTQNEVADMIHASRTTIMKYHFLD